MTQKQIDALKVGDIVLRHNKNGSVSTRVVREASRHLIRRGGPPGHIRTLYSFTKLRRSQYPSACTIIYPRELLDRRYVATGRRMRLTSRLDRKIARQLRSRSWRRIITQDDVVGVVA